MRVDRLGRQGVRAGLVVSAMAVVFATGVALADEDVAKSENDHHSVLDRIEVFGNVELRAEFNDNQIDRPDDSRGRIRVRLGAHYTWSESVLLGLRLTTGPQDEPAAPYQDLGTGLSSYTFTLDQAFVRWEPGFARVRQTTPIPKSGTANPHEDPFRVKEANMKQVLWLDAGKFHLRFAQNPVYNQIVWDHDVQPEGLMIGDRLNTKHIDVQGMLGYTTLLNKKDYGITSGIVQGQIAATWQPSQPVRMLLAFDGYAFSNVDSLIDQNAGNAAVIDTTDGAPVAYLSQFTVLHPVVAIRYEGLRFPIQLGAEYVKNTRANIPRDEAYAVGVSIGWLEAPDLEGGSRGEWRLWYQYMLVEQDAVFSPYVQDDTLLRTNARMHLFGVTYAPVDRLYLRAWALGSGLEYTTDAPGMDSDQMEWRTRFDVKFDF